MMMMIVARWESFAASICNGKAAGAHNWRAANSNEQLARKSDKRPTAAAAPEAGKKLARRRRRIARLSSCGPSKINENICRFAKQEAANKMIVLE